MEGISQSLDIITLRAQQLSVHNLYLDAAAMTSSSHDWTPMELGCGPNLRVVAVPIMGMVLQWTILEMHTSQVTITALDILVQSP